MARQQLEDPDEAQIPTTEGDIPYAKYTPNELLQASNLIYQRENVRLEWGDKAKDWAIKGLSKLPDQMDKFFTQRQAAGKKALGFLEGAFGGGFKLGGSWLRWAFIALIVVGGYAYLNANPGLWQGLAPLLSGPSLYYTVAAVSFTLLGGLYIVVRYRRAKGRGAV